MLEAIGLGPEAEQLYLALLDQPSQTRAELVSRLPGWSAARASRVLTDLVERGLVTTLTGRPLRYAAIAPDIALETLSRQQIEQVRKVQELVPRLMKLYWEATKSTTATDFVELVTADVEGTSQRTRQLHLSARSQVRAFERPPHPWSPNSLEPDELGALLDPDAVIQRENIANGVRYRVVYDSVEVEDAARWPDLRDSALAGEEIRIFDGLPVKLVLFDDLAATTALANADGQPIGIVVVHKSPLLDALSALFEMYWANAVPWVAPDTADSTEDQLVSLLASGHTDELIARRLGLSRSTVQRRVNDLMDRFGARTRFQLGLQLGRRLALEPRRT
ncbi:helix-turn-helix transcriptional regulator [Tenggerimyces flavus]|uniref:Helix-turn-helix domain-containing protein n=1 Tax=Tenggerimyces flavus TaxID=1708749 RepID=A0ABV7YR13_9ACTN|nr:helix-turn-helix transcriptional regulator [Tenggerimyces flavus]MBM7786409.1 DNA-binding CsgD family transcriptional regulator [Tenggerimyces flavus]